MLQRCNNPNNRQYHHYGGRGIKVCDNWLTFEGFLADMGIKSDGMSLDRIDPNGNYCKENCRWATNYTQQNNKRNNTFVEYNGKVQTLAQWARELDINYDTLVDRISRYGWSAERALTTKVCCRDGKGQGAGHKICELGGV